jgi:hypothetical protein
LGVSGFRIVLFFLQVFDVKKLAKKSKKVAKKVQFTQKTEKLEKKNSQSFWSRKRQKICPEK